MAKRKRPRREVPYHWLSFADPEKPKGTQFLGVAIVRARNPAEALTITWRLGINPGGAVLDFECPPTSHPVIPAEAIGRLLSQEDLDRLFPGETKKYASH